MIKQTLFTGWNFMRVLRLGLGVIIAIQAIKMHDMLSGGIAVFFLFQAITNTGCCGVNSCAMPEKDSNPAKMKEVDFEEVKTK